MATLKQFKTGTTARKSTDEGALPVLEFKIDDDEYKTLSPKSSQLAYLIAAGSDSRNEADQVAGVLDFMEQVLDPTSRRRLRKRLLDSADKLELENVVDLMEWMIEQWGARPPTSAGGS
jgi:hypothetical protein